jgi:hypothetical protein
MVSLLMLNARGGAEAQASRVTGVRQAWDRRAARTATSAIAMDAPLAESGAR